jgi:predicted ATP-grasp superfamily ATP-dependent carboligase
LRSEPVIRVGLFGTSVRAAAFSTLRAGLVPVGFDLFGDLDLRAVAQVERLPARADTEELAEILRRSGCDAWMYTGGWENEPERVDRLAGVVRLWGNPGGVLRRVRDLGALERVLCEAGFGAPEVRSDATEVPRDGTWLRKPVRSAGGRGIVAWDAGVHDTAGEPVVYQKRVEGVATASVHVADQGGCELVGVTRPLLGRPGTAFGYAGSVGPWPVGDEVRAEMGAVGEVVAQWAGLRGVFGIDWVIEDETGRPWVIEVNPRYTASVEVLELALGRAVVGEHARVFGADCGSVGADVGPRVVGKGILYAEGAVRLPGDWPGVARAPALFEVPEVADVPGAGERFEWGQPVLSVLVEGEDAESCCRRLDAAIAVWRERVGRGMSGLTGASTGWSIDRQGKPCPTGKRSENGGWGAIWGTEIGGGA